MVPLCGSLALRCYTSVMLREAKHRLGRSRILHLFLPNVLNQVYELTELLLVCGDGIF